MSKTIKIQMAARCEAAGRPNNEDNFLVASNLADNKCGFVADEILDLGTKGALLVVCDGMGGMNAGEVASEIAVTVIKQYFEADKLTDSIMGSELSMQHYMRKAIIAADTEIKSQGKADPSKAGMGSTCVMAWLCGQKAFVAWVGDSRCYRFNVIDGLQRLSHDHSYVQELVDAGKLSEDLAFDHPNGNIITRSLGDPSGPARPDTAVFPLRLNDIIMLCSDGLCGVLRDNEIRDVINQNMDTAVACRDALWETSKQVGWHDNVTIEVVRIVSGAPKAIAPKATEEPQASSKYKRLHIALGILLILVALGCGIYAGHKFLPIKPNPLPNEQKIVITVNDTTLENIGAQEGSTDTEGSDSYHASAPALNTSPKTQSKSRPVGKTKGEKPVSDAENALLQKLEENTPKGTTANGEQEAAVDTFAENSDKTSTEEITAPEYNATDGKQSDTSADETLAEHSDETPEGITPPEHDNQGSSNRIITPPNPTRDNNNPGK